MTTWQRLLIILSITFPTVLIDQLSKIFAANTLPRHEVFSYFSDTLRIGYTENIGAFLGLGNTLSPSLRFWIFVVAVGTILGGLLIYLLRNQEQDRFDLVCLTLVFSGGLSNFYDRAVNNGAVIDFINIGFGQVRTGIFNFADVFIMLGLFLLIAKLLFSKQKVPCILSK